MVFSLHELNKAIIRKDGSTLVNYLRIIEEKLQDATDNNAVFCPIFMKSEIRKNVEDHELGSEHSKITEKFKTIKLGKSSELMNLVVKLIEECEEYEGVFGEMKPLKKKGVVVNAATSENKGRLGNEEETFALFPFPERF